MGGTIKKKKMRKLILFLTGIPGRRWAALAMSLLALVLVYIGVWIFTATQTVKAAERWVSDRRAEGYAIRYEGLRATGFPLWIRIDLADPAFAAPNSPSPWGWEADSLVITARPWRPGRVRLHTSGAQMISYQAGDQRLTFNGHVSDATADLTFQGGDAERLAVTVIDLDLAAQQGAGGKISVANAHGILRRLASAGPRATTMALDVKSSRVEFPSSLTSPLGNRMEDLRLVARLQGDLPRGAGVPLFEALEIWRDGGGTIEIDQVALSYGPLVLNGDGTLALDGELQPIGAFTARVQGFFESIDAFSGAGMIGAGQAVSAKLLLGVFAQRPKNGGPATLNLAVTVQQRALYAGPVKLLRLPPVRWR